MRSKILILFLLISISCTAQFPGLNRNYEGGGANWDGIDVSQAIYEKSFYTGDQDVFPWNMCFSTSGHKMYIIGFNDDAVDEYTLTTSWDIGTASYEHSYVVTTQENAPRGIGFNDTGTLMHVSGTQDDGVQQYVLSTAWDVTSATFDDFLSTATYSTVPYGIFFSADGSQLFVTSQTNTTGVVIYDLSGAYDIGTAIYNSRPFFTGDYISQHIFSPDGMQVFWLAAKLRVEQTVLTSAYDISAVNPSNPDYTFTIGGSETSTIGLWFSADGHKMYTSGYSLDSVYQFSIAF